MLPFFVSKGGAEAVPIFPVTVKTLPAFIKSLQPQVKNWLEHTKFKGKPGTHALLPAKDGTLAAVVTGIEAPDVWSLAHLPEVLPVMDYRLDSAFCVEAETSQETMAVGWGLACYHFAPYKKNGKKYPSLVLSSAKRNMAEATVAAIHHARDLINTPANYLTPLMLADHVKAAAKKFGAECRVIAGEALLTENYPAIHAVGRASSNPPCLIDLRWGKKTHPRVTLVGKGVCFDTGGLDLKNASFMKLMKKDMGGAAVTLGLAMLIMQTKLPVQLRLLIPAVENSVGGNAYRPMDVLTTRKGLTVEIGDTDAEGRVILSDALCEGDSEAPDLLIDCATLTGAARVALGTDIPAFFTDDDALAEELYRFSRSECDPLWRLPLHMGYDEMITSKIADLNNIAESGYGGAIIAALFLKHFVEKAKRWVHLDMMAWNLKSRPGRPMGGEAMALRALYQLIKERYA